MTQHVQSSLHICTNNVNEIMLDEKTIYNYFDAWLLSGNNIYLPRRMRYHVRK